MPNRAFQVPPENKKNFFKKFMTVRQIAIWMQEGQKQVDLCSKIDKPLFKISLLL